VEHVYALIPGMDTLTSTASPPARRALRQVKWLTAGILIALVLLPSVAHADSGGATINTLPDSPQLEGHVEIQHECGGVFKSERERPCPWFGEAAQYPASVECPGVYDGSHGVWVGSVEQGSTTSSGSFAFAPEASEVILCLYVSADSSEELVGRSHPFNTRTGGEVLPQPAPKRATTTTLNVKVYGGCKAHIYAYVNGLPPVEGSWSRGELWGPSKAKFLPVSNSQPWSLAIEGPPGAYRFRMHYDGGAELQPSPPATVVFHLRRCTK
jgi:hypothetical protein